MDSGVTWRHLESFVPFRIQDVRFAPGESTGNTLIATTGVDSQLVTPGGGIWVSRNLGATWTKAVLAGCSSVLNGQGLGFVPGSNDIYAGTDCGLALSHDLGATWSIVYQFATFAVVPSTLSIPIDICAADPQGRRHHYRSSSSPLNFVASASGPDCQSVHSIAVSPFATNTIFATQGGTVIESDNAGANWTDLQASPFNALALLRPARF